MATNKQKQERLPLSTDCVEFNKINVAFRLEKTKVVKEWLISVSKKEGKSIESLSFNFCSDRYLLNINKKFLNHNYLTDIITFNLGTKELINGDIYISIDRVKENAREVGCLYQQELRRIMVHGILHLCGYNDKSQKDKYNMTRAEDYYLSLLPL